MNCLYPDINNLRCWICPHNPYIREMPPFIVCASLTPEMMKRLRSDCRADDLTVRNFDVIFSLPSALTELSRAVYEGMGLHVSKMPEGSPIPGNTRFSFSDDNAFAHDKEADQDAENDWEDDEDDEDDDIWEDEDDDDKDEYDDCRDCPDYPCPYVTGEDGEKEDQEDENEDDSLTHLNVTLLRSLLGQITELSSCLEDLLQSIFDLYPLFPDRKEALADMEDDIIAMMDEVDELVTIADAYGREYMED